MKRFLQNPSLLAGAIIVSLVVMIALFAPLISVGVEQMDMGNRFSGPTSLHWLGTDNFGRDLWARMAFGARVSLTNAFLSVAIAASVGTIVGLVAGYFGGWTDVLLMRITDIFLGFPAFILALAIVAVLGPGLLNVTAALVAVFWTEYARVVRASTMAIREETYVMAALAMGASHARIMFRDILPNALGPIIVLATLGFGTAIIAESALSFLGFGVAPPTPTWGWTLAYGTRFLRQSPWLSSVSGLAIMITVMGFNLLGDGLRDLLDPQLTGKSHGADSDASADQATEQS